MGVGVGARGGLRGLIRTQESEDKQPAEGCTYKQTCLYFHNRAGDATVKISEFRKWLAQKGATFEEGAKHTKVYYKGKQTTLPRHQSQQLGEGLRKAITKQLGIQ